MTSATAAAAARGRPRSADRTEAILEAVKELMMEVGYDRIRMQDVAERAGTGLATIYRRWDTKEALVAACMQAGAMPEIEVTGDARTDLRAMLEVFAEELAGGSEVIAGLVTACRDHAEIREAMQAHVIGETRPVMEAYITEIAGADVPGLELLTDMAAGVLLFRGAFVDEKVEPSVFADEFLALLDALAARPR